MPRRPPSASGVAPDLLSWGLFAAVPLVFLGRGGKTIELWCLAAAFLLAVPFLWRRLPRVVEIARHPAFPGLAGALIWHTVPWVFSDQPAAGFLPVGKIWVLAAFGAGAYVLWTPKHFRAFENLVMAFGALHTAAFAFPLGAFIFPGNPHYGALWTAAGSLLALRRFWDARAEGNLRRWAWLSCAAALAAGLYFMHVRSVLAGYGVGLLVFAGLAAGRRAFLGVLAALVLAAALMPETSWRRTLKLDDPLAWKRVDIWSTAFRGIEEKPVLGWGPGQFESLYRRHGLPQSERLLRHELSTSLAHNDFLQAAADAGMPALIFWLAAIGGFLWSRPRGPGAPAGFGVLAAWGVTSLANFPFALPVNGFLLAVVAASLEPSRRPRLSPSGEGVGRAGRGLLLAGAAFFAAGFFLTGAASLANRLGGPLVPWDPRWAERKLATAGELMHGPRPDPAGAQGLAREVIRFYPGRAEAWHTIAHAAADHMDPVDPRAAYENYARAMALRPHHAPWWREWADFAERAGRLEDARALLRDALALEPAYADAVLARARIARLQGKPRRGERVLRRYMARRSPDAEVRPGDSSYRAAVLDWRPDRFALELALCQLDQKLFREALETLKGVPPGPEREKAEAAARRGLKGRP